ncbi:MAG: metallophosphoesterase [Bacteroidales bacterium]|nr:metallophosphoesterase [Bacteroidales bacterium]
MKKLKFFYLLSMIFFLVTSCEKDQLPDPPDQPVNNFKTIAVVPDIHYMHPDLLPGDVTASPSLMEYLGLDRKLLEISDPIFRKVYSELIEEKPDILLIPGDLTKDGELMSHEVMANLLQDLENAGIKVYVIPGNNDIDNPDALSYVTEPPVPVENIDADDFAEIYGNFGYNEALYRDENSLSYICQPYSNLWILGIDNN